MYSIEKNAISVANENVVNATSGSIIAAENAAGINLNQDAMNAEKKDVVETTRIAIIDGEEKEITVAYTKYSMRLPDYNGKLCKTLDHVKMIPVLHCFTRPEIFYNEGLELYDRAGKVIEKGTPDVFVYCSCSDGWRIWIEKRLERVEVLNFTSVQEYAQAIGASNLYSRGMNNTERIGIAALATGNKAYQDVFKFAKENELSSATACLYLDIKITKLQMEKMSTGLVPKTEPKLGRNLEEAAKLLLQVKETFGKNASKRYAIRAINVLDHQRNYNLSMIIAALQELTQEELSEIETASSDARESTITLKLTEHLVQNPNKEMVDRGAA